MSIEIKNITKKFGDFTALKDVSLLIPEGKLLSLLGPSGSGKTTLLRIIAGLEAFDSGAISFHGKAAGNDIRSRKVGFVFQHYALFRHMTVFENVAFGLRVRRRKFRLLKSEIRDRVFQLLKLVQIERLSDHYPSQISGGQRQRVAFARSLAVEPEVLLLDEPFGALDAKVRKELRRWLRRLHEEIRITSVFVTHDQEEALDISDMVVIMNEGRIEQTGSPHHVYDRPANPFVFQFLGSVNLFRTKIHDGVARIGNVEIESPDLKGVSDISAVVYIRPHDVEICRHLNGKQGVEAVISHINTNGSIVHLELDTQVGERIDVELSRERFRKLNFQDGEIVFAILKNPSIFTGALKEQR